MRKGRLQMVFWVALGLCGFTVGGLVVTGLLTFSVGKGASYLSNNPKVCINCHIMNPQYESWGRGSHHAVATCNDCHTPDNLVGKYITKARNGWAHGVAFTTGNFHEPIQIKEHNREITLKRCISCHGEFLSAQHPEADSKGERLNCMHCHSDVGHAR